MATITGKWEVGTGRKVWKNIRLSINKYSKFAAERIISRSRYDLERWESDVSAVISDPLAKSEWSKARDPKRRWPHLNTGTQERSIDSWVRMKVTGSGNYSITSWAEIGVPYSRATNVGYPPRADGETPNWVGWLDDVFYGDRGFFSVSDVFERLMVDREVL